MELALTQEPKTELFNRRGTYALELAGVFPSTAGAAASHAAVLDRATKRKRSV